MRINDAEVAPKFLERAARLVQDQLGERGLDQIGGKTWWQWRRPEQPLRAEWIEMKKEYHERKRTGEKCERVILYVHGGAYYFGSVDEHRYQMQRHARKLRARVLSPRYRLAPQFPFPCGLFDCLATYFYLLEHFDPTQIIFAGDSAGGGMILSMLVVLRDQGQPLPAGTILISPWVDLTHSFPSVAGDGIGDYIPPHGFHHKPSMAWPPPPSDGIKKPSGNFGTPTDAVELPATVGLDMKHGKKSRGGVDDEDDNISALPQPKKQDITALPVTQFAHPLSLLIDGKMVELREQIQMYTTNELLAHPLVSPVMQPSLGGLPPMLIQVGGAELLRDEQIYIAHKAANPSAFPPNETIMREFDPERKTVDKYPPTDVQLQLWEDLCHVTPTLSFTRPAKYMYRSIAQFGAWALARAQEKTIEIQNDDAISIISSISGEAEDDDTKSVAESSKDSNGSSEKKDRFPAESKHSAIGAVGKAGDPIPPFKDHMIRQRVSRHGVVFPLAPEAELACLALDPASIGVPKTGPVRKWLATRSSHDQRFANETKKVHKKRAKESGAGYDEIPGENPPPAALVNRRRHGVAPEEKKKGKSWGLAMWSGWGSSHDEHTLQREQKSEKTAAEMGRKQSLANGLDENGASTLNLGVPASSDGKKTRRTSNASKLSSQMPWSLQRDRPRSPFTQVRDTGQTGEGSPSLSAVRSPITNDDMSEIAVSRPISMGVNSPIPVDQDAVSSPVPTTGAIAPDSEKIPGTENTYLSPTSSRPHNGFQAYPFKLRDQQQNQNPSTVTLDSQFRGGTSTPASGAHSELVGDVPAPVELPSATSSSSASAVSTPASRSTEELTAEPSHTPNETFAEPPPPAVEIPRLETTTQDLVSPMDNSKDEGLTTPTSPENAKSSALPFKMRSTIFDPRTSMLGSIGADGMPNAHHDFPVRSDSSAAAAAAALVAVADNVPENTTPQTAVSREPGKPNEATKAAPFKLRHTVYEPNVTLAKREGQNAQNASKVSSEEPLPTSAKQSGSSSASGSERRSPSPASASGAGVARSSVSSGDKPPSYHSVPLTHVVLPEPVAASRPVVRDHAASPDAPGSLRSPAYDDERPPTPPPKDEKPYFMGFKKMAQGNGAAKKGTTTANGGVNGKENGLKSANTAVATAPMIGELGFEKKEGLEEKRPPLESFVTAREGEVRSS